MSTPGPRTRGWQARAALASLPETKEEEGLQLGLYPNTPPTPLPPTRKKRARAAASPALSAMPIPSGMDPSKAMTPATTTQPAINIQNPALARNLFGSPAQPQTPAAAAQSSTPASAAPLPVSSSLGAPVTPGHPDPDQPSVEGHATGISPGKRKKQDVLDREDSKEQPTGFMGLRNVEKNDILGGSATGYPGNSRSFVGGDTITPSKETINTRQDTLRPMYGMANPMSVIPRPIDQIRSDLIFTDFSIVAPHNGLGVTNKMSLMQDLWEEKIQFKEPMDRPRDYQGPSGTVVPAPIEWQNAIPKRDIQKKRVADKIHLVREFLAVSSTGQGSTNVLGNDYGLLRTASFKGLPRAPESVLEPTILRPTPMERVRPPTGLQLQSREMRRLWDSQRYPERFSVNMAYEGGPTTPVSRAYRLLPFPIGSP